MSLVSGRMSIDGARSLTNSILINLFIKSGLNNFLLPPLLSIVFVQGRVQEGSLTRASSETQELLAGTMRYFRASDIFGAKVYFKGWRAPVHFFLPNEF